MKEFQIFFSKHQNVFFICLVFFIFLISKALLFLKYPLYTYGYDYGFYLHAVNTPTSVNFSSLIGSWRGGFENILFNFANLIGLPATTFLYYSLIFFATLGGIFFFLSQSKSRLKTGLISVLLLALSVPQTEASIMFLWKNIAALPFFILGLFAMQKKQWRFLILATTGMLIFHRTSAIFFLLTLGLFGGYSLWKKKKYSWLLLITFCLPIIFTLSNNALNGFLVNIFTNPNITLKEGLFLNHYSLFKIFWPFGLLAAPGIFLAIKQRKNLAWFMLFLITGAWLIFELPFYRRALIFFDLSLIVFAAEFLGQLQYNSVYKKIALGVIIIFLGTQYFYYLTSTKPLISEAEILEIQNFKPQKPGDFLLAVSANDAPWLLGFSQNFRLGAPGLFEDRNTYEEWRQFWAGRNQTQFLWKYPRPLYFYQRSYKITGPVADCLVPLSENFYEYVCRN